MNLRPTRRSSLGWLNEFPVVQTSRLRLEENFDRFNSKIHKEKEMVSFRRLAIAIAVLAVFAGLASAQTQPLQCQTNIAVTPTLRSEGYTEQTGDVTLICTGGAAQAVGTLLPQVNIA